MLNIVLPETWIFCELSNIAHVVTGKTPSKKNKENFDGHIPFIKPGDLGSSTYIKSTEEKLSEKGLKFVPSLPKNSILVSCIGNLGKVGITTAIISATNQQINAVLVDKNIDFKYLYYQLITIKDWLKKESSATTIPIINKSKFEKAPIIIPPLSEQKIIAEKLDLLLAEVQETKSRLEQIPELLKQFRQSVLSDACFCDFSTNTDKYQFWKKSSLKELTTKIGSGSTPKGGNNVYKNKGIPLVRSMNIYSNYIKYDDLAYIDDEQAKKLANVEIQFDDILLNITGASIGRVNMAPQLFVGGRVNQHVSIIRCNKQKLLPKFLQIYLASPEIQKWIVKENYGATRQALTKSMIEQLIISYPPLQEQNEIVRRVEQLFAYADKIEQQVNTALEKVNHLPQSILAKAFRGELTAQWRAENVDLITGENSAASLLEKIQVERAQNNKNKKKK